MRTYTYPAQATTYSTTTYPTEVTASPLVRWGAVFSGAVVALALTLLAGTLWVALAFGSHDAVFFNHLAWWFGGTAIAGMFIAALIAAGVSGARGRAAGLANGVTTWGVVVLGGLAAGIPGLLAYGSTRPVIVNGIRVAVTTVRPWTTFWSLLIGLGVAVLGGLLGGTLRHRPVDGVVGGIAAQPAMSSVRGAGVPVAEVPVTQ